MKENPNHLTRILTTFVCLDVTRYWWCPGWMLDTTSNIIISSSLFFFVKLQNGDKTVTLFLMRGAGRRFPIYSTHLLSL